MDVAAYYRSLADERHSIMEAGIADPTVLALQTTSHNALKDFELLLSVMSGDERSVFVQACREYQYALEAVMFGSYRNAYASLRLSFELFIATMYFSAHQLKLKLWLAGHDDLLWGMLNDPDKGVFSHNFLKAFNADLGPYRQQYMGLSSTVYRECSQYVHGNPETHEDTSQPIGFDPTKAKDFHDKVSSVKLCVLFAFVVRYLPSLNKDQKQKIEHLIMESFGEIAEVQAEFEV